MKKSLLNIIMIVLVLTNTILTTIMLFVVVPGMQDSNRIIKKVAQAVNLELDTREIDVSDVPLDECETFDLETKEIYANMYRRKETEVPSYRY